jgi:hypothetical protein
VFEFFAGHQELGNLWRLARDLHRVARRSGLQIEVVERVAHVVLDVDVHGRRARRGHRHRVRNGSNHEVVVRRPDVITPVRSRLCRDQEGDAREGRSKMEGRHELSLISFLVDASKASCAKGAAGALGLTAMCKRWMSNKMVNPPHLSAPRRSSWRPACSGLEQALGRDGLARWPAPLGRRGRRTSSRGRGHDVVPLAGPCSEQPVQLSAAPHKAQSSCSAFPPSWDRFPAGFGQVAHRPREGPGERSGACQLDVDFAILKHFGEFGLLCPRPARTLKPARTPEPARSAKDARARRLGESSLATAAPLRTQATSSAEASRRRSTALAPLRRRAAKEM